MSSPTGPFLGPEAQRMLDCFLSDPDFRERVCNDPETEVGNFDLKLEELGSLRAIHRALGGSRDRDRHAFALGMAHAALCGDEAGVLFW